jgi:outer membrane protein assembly factor BamB
MSNLSRPDLSFRRFSLNALTRSALSLFALLGVAALGTADDWRGFRGTQGDAYSPDKNTPVKWSSTDNIAWKHKLPGPGSSSAIVVGDKVLVASYSGLPDAKLMLHLTCLDRAKGTPLWQKDIPAKLPELPYTDQGSFITEHGYASSTPVSDGTNVYAFFGKTGVFAFDLKGNQLWHKSVGDKLDKMKWGTAASPVLVGDLVIVNANIESGDLVALNKLSGSEVWRKPVGDNSWTTPALVEAPGGKKELVLSMPGVVKGYDPQTGDELWRCKGIPKFTTSSPETRGDIAYVSGGGAPFQAVGFAVKSGGKGDVSKNFLWEQGIGSGITSPVVAGKYLFAIDRQKLGCFSAATGKLVTSRPVGYKGWQYTSPVVADGKVYWVNRTGTVYVFSADEKMTPLGENRMEEDEPRFDGTPALSDGQLFIRSTHYLYCVGKK